MRLSLLPAFLLVAASVAPVAAAEGAMPSACTSSCAACLRAASHLDGDQAAILVAKPWYIGPKGGDTRKGHAAAPGQSSVNTPATVSAAMTPVPWYIGPKGGDTRKGHSVVPSGLAVHDGDAVASARTCDNYQAPASGPKGGLIKQKGESDAAVQARADAACFAACTR